MRSWFIAFFSASFLFYAGLGSSGSSSADGQIHNGLNPADPASQIWHQAAESSQRGELPVAAFEPALADTPLDVPELLFGRDRAGFLAVSSAPRQGFDRDALPPPYLEEPQRPPRSSLSLV